MICASTSVAQETTTSSNDADGLLTEQYKKSCALNKERAQERGKSLLREEGKNELLTKQLAVKEDQVKEGERKLVVLEQELAWWKGAVWVGVPAGMVLGGLVLVLAKHLTEVEN